MNKIITEITPLSEKDCFYLVDRHKSEFDYPIHRHNELEINFVSGCVGARRVVGDSIEVLGDCDLVLIGPNLEHGWDQHICDKNDKREITIQFSQNLLGDELLVKNQLKSINTLLQRAKHGVAFGMNTTMSLYSRLDELTKSQPGFMRLLKLLEIIYLLSIAADAATLSTSSFSNTHVSSDSRRINRVEEEINRRFNEDLTLDELASIAGMTPTAFSRFFKRRTGRNLSEYIIDIRLGHAARQLVDTTMSIAEICYESGFNNISNFNRAFKRKKGCTPKVFRDNYLKTKLII